MRELTAVKIVVKANVAAKRLTFPSFHLCGKSGPLKHLKLNSEKSLRPGSYFLPLPYVPVDSP
jgi:hypothetical protein